MSYHRPNKKLITVLKYIAIETIVNIYMRLTKTLNNLFANDEYDSTYDTKQTKIRFNKDHSPDRNDNKKKKYRMSKVRIKPQLIEI